MLKTVHIIIADNDKKVRKTMIDGKVKLEFGKHTLLTTNLIDVNSSGKKAYMIAIKKLQSNSILKNIKSNQKDWCADALMIFQNTDAVDDLIDQLNELKNAMQKGLI